MRSSYKRWTAEEDEALVRDYPILGLEVKLAGRSKSAISNRCCKLAKKGLIDSSRWTEGQEAILIKEYPTSATKLLCEKLGKTRSAIKLKAMRLGLKCRENCKKLLWGGPRPKGKRSNRFQGHEGLSAEYISSVRRAAKQRDLEYPLLVKTEENLRYLWNLYLSQDKKCAICGINIEFATDSKSRDATASLDRIDSEKGYVMGNVQWVHKWVNQMKWDLPQEEFVDICYRIADYQRSLRSSPPVSP